MQGLFAKWKKGIGSYMSCEYSKDLGKRKSDNIVRETVIFVCLFYVYECLPDCVPMESIMGYQVLGTGVADGLEP